MYRSLTLIGICLYFLFIESADAQQLAFPDADGWGKYTIGGRGGAVIEVTNLYDSGEGSLRNAIQASGPRTIVFRVSGTIFLKSDLKISRGDVTIAGQTAPGDGICLANYPLRVEANNVIIRYIRSRLGDISGQEKDALWVEESDSVIIDHCSFSWSVDETASAYLNKNFTMQYCIISESLYNSIHSKGYHGYGGIWGGSKASFHHNLIAHHTSRLPRFNGARYSLNWDELVDHRNNVIYNWGFNSAYGGEPSENDGNKARINLVKNYYKAGPATRSGELQYRIVSPDPDPQYGYSEWYIDSNEVDNYPGIVDDNWATGVQGVSAEEKLAIRSETVFPYQMESEETASEAYLTVLSNVGANLPNQDTVDRRIIWEVINDTALFGATYGAGSGIIDSQEEVGGWPALFSAPVLPDSDHDGMPDQWEIDNGLNADDPDDRNNDDFGNGYTNLEEYLNSITAWGDFIKPPTDLNIELSGLNNVLLNWVDNTDNESGFFIERSDTGDYEVIDTLPPDRVAYADSNLDYETNFSYRLRAFTDSGLSTYSNIRSITTLSAVSLPLKAYNPSPAHYENNVDVNPALTWIPGNGTEFHKVYFGTSNPPGFVGDQIENVFYPGPLQYNTAYYWRIDEANANGITEGQVWKFITEQSTDIEKYMDHTSALTINIYPNPITNRQAIIEYSLEESDDITVSLLDMYGRILKTDHPGYHYPGVYRHSFDLSGIPDGAYLLIIRSSRSNTAVRIIVAAR